jgi:tRNA(fMet)-specific endonuclease VapC
VARLILDTSVLVAGARGLLDESDLAGDDDIALPAVAVAEYLAGVLLDCDPARQAASSPHLAVAQALVNYLTSSSFQNGLNGFPCPAGDGFLPGA